MQYFISHLAIICVWIYICNTVLLWLPFSYHDNYDNYINDYKESEELSGRVLDLRSRGCRSVTSEIVCMKY